MQSPPTNSELPRRLARRFLGELPRSVLEQSGGLSGARVWRVESSMGTFALRQYPTEFPTQERLRWLHGFLQEVQTRGCALLPCPVATQAGTTWIEHDSQYWEMLSWVHGEPLLETAPSRALLLTAAAALARLHALAEKIPQSPLDQPGKFLQGLGRGLFERVNLAKEWQDSDQAQVEQLLEEKHFSPKLRHLFQIQKRAFHQGLVPLGKLVQQAAQVQDRLFPVLRDVQPAHVIFAGTEVDGFIDIAAARVDSAMGDLDRLLHRWRFAEPAWYADAVEAYSKVRPLENNERLVLDVYDYSARLLTGVQWLHWIVLEERVFANQALVEQHWERAARDLEQLLRSGWPEIAKPSVFLG